MLLCHVIGSVVATAKEPRLRGLKLMIVEVEGQPGAVMVAADTVGAGVGDRVLVVSGGAARETEATRGAPVDAAVVAIVDVPGLAD